VVLVSPWGETHCIFRMGLCLMAALCWEMLRQSTQKRILRLTIILWAVICSMLGNASAEYTKAHLVPLRWGMLWQSTQKCILRLTIILWAVICSMLGNAPAEYTKAHLVLDLFSLGSYLLNAGKCSGKVHKSASCTRCEIFGLIFFERAMERLE
jgi:hypothetical protein